MKPLFIKGTSLGMDKSLVLLTMSDLMSRNPLRDRKSAPNL